jgi:inorganic phosphate transporter, PiT family
MTFDFSFLVALIALALLFDYINGFHDAANAIATVVATRVLSPKTAIVYGALMNLVGAMAGTGVAATVGKGLVNPNLVTLDVVFCGLMGAIIWNLITWYKGLPSSSSHALMGALVGAAFAAGAIGMIPEAGLIHWEGLVQKALIPMVLSPILGFGIGFLVMLGLTWLVYRWSLPRTNKIFGVLQIVSAGMMAFSHGNNDAQKSMGIIALALMTYAHGQGQTGAEFHVPQWVIFSCALAIGLGTLSGGWKIIRTLGTRMLKLQPIHGFAAETTACLIIESASTLHIPVSTTHVISSSIMGVGSTKRLSAVNWNVVGNILVAWVLTIPISFGLSALIMVAYHAAKKALGLS